jgi:hypothetical protein
MQQPKQQSNQQIKFKFLNKISALIFLGSLAACGGGGSNSGSGSGGGTGGGTDHEIVPPSITEFTRMGMDVDPNGRITSGDLGATIDTSANITFKTPTGADQSFPYDFTFASGFPGGYLKTSGLSTTTLGAANKVVRILGPSVTDQVQNVFWSNADNPSVYGFGEAGYRLIPNAITWPASGTVTYSGRAFQYIVDRYAGTGAGSYGYALYTLNASATIDYATKTMVINMDPVCCSLIDSANSSVSDVATSQLGATLNLVNLNFASNYFESLPAANQSSGLGLGSAYVESLDFFSADAHVLAGVVSYTSFGSLNPPLSSDPNYLSTAQTFSFVLERE